MNKKKLLLFVVGGAMVSNYYFFIRLQRKDDDAPTTTTTIHPRVFWAPNDTRSLCIPQQGLFAKESLNAPTSEGLLFVRIPKCGSSTTGGVAARIAHSMARKYYPNNATTSNNNTTACLSRMTHAWSTRFLFRRGSFASRSPDKSFLWTMLRDPAQRALSGFYYFRVHPQFGYDPNKDAVKYLKKQTNVLCKWVGAKNTTPAGTQQVLHEFNFIGLLERLDESLVILQLLLNLKPQDVLYMSAKQSGHYDSLRHGCKASPENVARTPKAKKYLLSHRHWKSRNAGDYLLYNAVNGSIDATINHIGRNVFKKALLKFQRIKAFADSHCKYKSPCISEGVYRPKEEPKSNCYFEDWACGYECLDDLFAGEQ